MKPNLLSAGMLLLASCGQSWSSAEDCEGLSRGPDADECWAAHAADLFRKDAAAAEKTVTERVDDSRVRDYIWLTVTREVDPTSYRYCDKIQEQSLAERCRVLVSRPHLHRELMKGEGGGVDHPGAGGGPAPGAGGPPRPQEGGSSPGQQGEAPSPGGEAGGAGPTDAPGSPDGEAGGAQPTSGPPAP